VIGSILPDGRDLHTRDELRSYANGCFQKIVVKLGTENGIYEGFGIGKPAALT
jgi:hypothetical protein